MDIGKRIKERRKALGLSAEDVAERMGVSPATVYRYESRYIANMGIDKVTPIASALRTSEAYLLGWTDDPTISLDAHGDSLNALEQKCIASFRLLNSEGQSKAVEYINDLVASGNYSASGGFDCRLAAHERTDIEGSEEEKKHDIDILNDDNF